MNITNISRQASQQHSQEYRILSLTTIFLMILIDDVCKATSFTTRPDSRSNPLPPSPVATSPTSSSLPFPSPPFVPRPPAPSLRPPPSSAREGDLCRSVRWALESASSRPSVPTLSYPCQSLGRNGCRERRRTTWSRHAR